RVQGGGIVPTYDNAGFLAWDPSHMQMPPGDSDLSELDAKLSEMASGVGTLGCGYESQLESIYRFLVDPTPYASISVVDGQAVASGMDSVLLGQRAEFLRADSAVAVVLVTDENDCSTREGGAYFYSGEVLSADGTRYHLPRARSECAQNPDDPCCASCSAQ